MPKDIIDQITRDITNFISQPNALGSVLALITIVLVAYWLSKFIAKGIIRVAQIVAVRSDKESDEDRIIRLRQIETYLSIIVALVRVALVVFIGFVAWRIFSPTTSSASIAAIGAGTIFIVIAGQTIGPLLRDVTAGATMIAEKWFNVGDFIKVEPFWDVSGVVERFTLRSTRIRQLSGEVVWIHNQQITAVHVSPRGVRMMAVDVFVRDRTEGERTIEHVIGSIPTGATLLARPLRIKYAERWDDELWRITVVGETPPGREWLIEKYFINALKDVDEGKKKADRIFVQEPIARFADPTADRRFKRSVRVAKD